MNWGACSIGTNLEFAAMRIWVSDGDRRLQEGSGYGQLSRAISRGLLELGHEVQFQQFPEMELVLFICPPGNIRFGRPVPCAAITMHELDHLPEAKQHWPAVLNRLDLVITPTEWNREVWQREGVTTPIAVVPLGVDPSLYFPVTGRCCTFMCVHENLGGDSSRENWRETLLAYCSKLHQRGRRTSLDQDVEVETGSLRGGARAGAG